MTKTKSQSAKRAGDSSHVPSASEKIEAYPSQDSGDQSRNTGTTGTTNGRGISTRDFMKISLHTQQKKHFEGTEKHWNPMEHEPAVDPYQTSYQSFFKPLDVQMNGEHLDSLRKQKDIRGKLSYNSGNPLQPIYDAIACTSVYQASYHDRVKPTPPIDPNTVKNANPRSSVKVDINNTVKSVFNHPHERTYATSYNVEFISPKALEKLASEDN